MFHIYPFISAYYHPVSPRAVVHCSISVFSNFCKFLRNKIQTSVNSADWTDCEKAHTCPLCTPVSACRALRRDCVQRSTFERKTLCCFQVPESRVASLIHEWKTIGTSSSTTGRHCLICPKATDTPWKSDLNLRIGPILTWEPTFQRYHCSKWPRRSKTSFTSERQIMFVVNIYLSSRNNARVHTFWMKVFMQSPPPPLLFGILFECDHPIPLTRFGILLPSLHFSSRSSPSLLPIKCSKPSQHLDFRGRMAAIFT